MSEKDYGRYFTYQKSMFVKNQMINYGYNLCVVVDFFLLKLQLNWKREI